MGEKIAVLGTGSIGTRHLEILRALDGVEPWAIPSRDSRRRELADAGHKVAKALDDLAFDGAIICTETMSHPEDVVDAVEAGVPNILVEKPIAASLEPAREATRALRSSQTTAHVGYNLRFDRGYRRLRHSIDEFGPVHATAIEARAYLPDWRPDRDHRDSYSASPEQGGVLRDLSHEIDYALDLFGVPERVEASLRNTGQLGIDSEEQAHLRWQYDGGPVVEIALDYLTRPRCRTARLYSVDGTLAWDVYDRTVEKAEPNEDPETEHVGGSWDEMYRCQDRAFLDVIGGGQAPQMATWTDGLDVLALADAARRSDQSGRPEPVETITDD